MSTRSFIYQNPNSLTAYDVRIHAEKGGSYKGEAVRKPRKGDYATRAAELPTIRFDVSEKVGKAMHETDSYLSQVAGFDGAKTLSAVLP